MKTILLMEDEPLIGEALQELLEKNNYKVDWVTNTTDAMGILRGGTSYDFVLSDGSGWRECYELAIVNFGNHRVVIFTGTEEIARTVRACGVTAFTKPERLTTIVAHINKVCSLN